MNSSGSIAPPPVAPLPIEDVLFAPGFGGFFNDDQAAIRAGARRDGEIYTGTPITQGYPAIRVPARALCIGLALTDGYVAWGDAMSVQYAGAGGRSPRFDPGALAPDLRAALHERLCAAPPGSFRDGCASIADAWVAERQLHTALAYGLSQALLGATAHVRGVTMAEVLCDEYELPLVAEPVPIYAQSGDARHANVDKMILRGVDVLPHGLVNNAAKFGADGVDFLEYVRWTARRVREIGGEGYAPILYFDVYGLPGIVFGHSTDRIADYLTAVEDAAAPFAVRLESPADFGSEDAQIEGFAALRRRLRERGSRLEIAVDEWCNSVDDVRRFLAAGAADVIQIKMPDLGALTHSIEAVGLCRAAGVVAYLGGSCTETDTSARVAVHVAVATRADMLLARPGMGVDEGVMIVANEQSRLLARIARRGC
jgi:methylaspartate ammonia-lyase